MNHQCTNNQQCEMTPFSRNSCQFCRLKKCFAVGMSREASRLGRRPKRAKDEKDGVESLLASPFNSYSHNGSSMDNATITPETTPHKQQHYQQQGNFVEISNQPKETATPKTKSSEENSVTIIHNHQHQHMKQNTASVIRDQHSLSNLEFNNTAPHFSVIQPPFKLDSFQENPKTLKSPVSKLEFSTSINTSATTTAKKDFETSNGSLAIGQYPKKNKSPIATSPDPTTLPIKQEQVSTAPSPPVTPCLSQNVAQQQHHMHQIEMLTKLISISDRHTSIERTNELEFIRTSIIESHCQIWPTTFEKIRRRYAERPPVRAPHNPNPASVRSQSLFVFFCV